MRRHSRGQSTLEYAILVTIVIGALIAMQIYVKRGFQGRWKSTVDDFGEQYDPRTVNSLINYSLVSNTDTTIEAFPSRDTTTGAQGFTTNRTDITSSFETKQGNTVVGPVE